MEDNFVIEDAFERLAEINKSLEDEGTSLDEALKLYGEGVKLVGYSRGNRGGVEKEIQILNEV